MTLSDLAKYSATRNNARPLSYSRAYCTLMETELPVDRMTLSLGITVSRVQMDCERLNSQHSTLLAIAATRESVVKVCVCLGRPHI